MKDIYYIITTISVILTFCIRYKQSKKHLTTANSNMLFEVNINLNWFKLNFKTIK